MVSTSVQIYFHSSNETSPIHSTLRADNEYLPIIIVEQELLGTDATVSNSLPVDVQSAPSLTIFRQKLKTQLFRQSYPDTIL